ncbi:hypothetical protein BDW22DRAFT_1092622 [Trametopsis cervina]|nr:hypothetical protein BDW22DRAFT_1092622 [Trametopsis cervina]
MRGRRPSFVTRLLLVKILAESPSNFYLTCGPTSRAVKHIVAVLINSRSSATTTALTYLYSETPSLRGPIMVWQVYGFGELSRFGDSRRDSLGFLSCDPTALGCQWYRPLRDRLAFNHHQLPGILEAK